MIVFRSVMSHYSYWISSTPKGTPVSIFMVAQRGRFLSNIWAFNNDEY